jgi:hypothetical protein
LVQLRHSSHISNDCCIDDTHEDERGTVYECHGDGQRADVFERQPATTHVSMILEVVSNQVRENVEDRHEPLHSHC